MADKKVTKANETKTAKTSSKAGQKIVAKTKAARQHSRSVSGRSRAHSGSEQSKRPRRVKSNATSLTAQMFDVHGKSTGTVSLPKETFGQKPNAKLLAQAVRVYQANLKPHTANTKTRGEVRGGGRKPWRQKGTGRARAGSIRSPLWRGGGITFGPRYKDVKLTLPKKMKHKALIYALSDKAQGGNIKIIVGIEKITPKTKVVATLLKKLEAQKNVLLVVSQKNQNVSLASRNIPSLEVDLPQNLNAYEVLRNNQLLISKEALSKFV